MWTSYAGVRYCLHGTESTLWSPLNRIIILHTLIIRINIFLWWFKSRDVAVFFYWLMLIIIANILEKNARNFSQHFAFSIHILTTVLWCRHCYYSHFQRWTFLSKISQEHTPIKGYMLGCEFSPCGSLPITGKLHYHLRVLYIPSIFNQSILPQRVEGEHSQEDKRYSITIVSL